MATPSFMAFTAIRVPPIQFKSFVGMPPRLHTSDLMSGCGPLVLPSPLSDIMKMIQDGAAFAADVAGSVANQIAATMGQATAALNGMIASATGATLAALQGLNNAILGSGMGALQAQLNEITNGMPGMASMIASANDINGPLGIPPISLPGVFAPILAGGVVNTALGAVSSVMGNITSAISAGVGAVAAIASTVMATVTSAVSAAVSVATTAIAGITAAVGAALSTLTNMVSAAAMSIVCPGLNAIGSFMNSIASPQMLALRASIPMPSV